MEYNGGSVIAMVGKECVAIACDLRLGNQSMGISSKFEKVFPMTDRVYLGLPGLATDVLTLREQFRYRLNMYTIKEEREIEPETFAHLVSSTLYERRFGPYFIEPVIAGLQKTAAGGYKPFIAATDLIGCINFAKDFVVSGTASSKLFGMAEGLWEPDLEPEDLFETCAQTLLNAVDRDAYSGWGAVVHVITKDKVIKLFSGPPGVLQAAKPMMYSSVRFFTFALCLLPVIGLLVHIVPYFIDAHGLRQYPGPFLAKFTDGWLFWVSHNSTRSYAVDELHQKYGPFVRIAPNHISVASPAAVSAVYGHSSGTTKASFYDIFKAFRRTRGIFNTRSRPEHARKRRVMAHMFAPQSVLAFEEQVRGYLSTLLKQWDSLCVKAGSANNAKGTLGYSAWEVRGDYVWFDVRFWCNLFTFDVIGELAFGSSFGMLVRGEDTVRIAKSAKAGMASYALPEATVAKDRTEYEVKEVSAIEILGLRGQMAGTVGVLPQYMRALMQRLPKYNRGAKALSELTGMGADVVSRRLAAARQEGADEKSFDDMFDRLLNGRDENGDPMGPEELTAEAITLLVAGSDTTSNSLSAIIYYLARDQEAQKKLQAELDAVANNDSSILPFEDIKSLPYLEAVINEGLRLFTTLGFGLPRVVPKGGLTVLGHTFPGGTEISVPTYSLHHSNEVWGPNVDEFYPERWLDAERRSEMMKAFTPFSVGPRACIGRNIAMVEMTLCVANIFRRYNTVIEPGQMLEVEDNIVRRPRECVAGIKRRCL
ncbi:Benzoate 4-monooxygenase [Sparassis crispa]|uniref:Benzoate 4-monooxygenase n=1 Tax=Sparassis crispa TaxID=139825 RepID=A0A401GQA2_9APHY|nr:Benzoate 4-monooxygenase [Sparassis crispa]GBE84398.1 Benzoate 4-monooxygenase [Sparassis crispa]